MLFNFAYNDWVLLQTGNSLMCPPLTAAEPADWQAKL